MRRPQLVRVPFLVLLLLTAPVAVQAQGANTLQGRVVLPNGSSPPTPVKITLTFNGMRVYETFTDLSGRFSFTSLRRGTYQLTAEGDGETFETTTVYADVTPFGNAPLSFTQNIQLRPKIGKAVTKASVVSVDELDPGIPERARKEYQKGLNSARDNRPDEAIKHFNEAITTHPAFYSAHFEIGEQYSKLKRYDEAVAAYQKAIALRSDRALPHIGLGATLVKQGKHNDALAPLRRGIELDKQSSAAYLFLGYAEMMTGDLDSSEANLLRAYEIGKPAIAHIYLANVYELRGNLSEAISHLQDFLKENPEAPDAQRLQIREAIEKLRKRSEAKK